jgi:hypothetical protein
MKPSRLIPIASVVLATGALSADPAWWTTRGVKTASPASNLSPATIGQAKHIAAMALAELKPRLDALSYLALKADVTAVVNFALPTTAEQFEEQRAVLVIGQLKAIADPFYRHLNGIVPLWLAQQRAANGTQDALNPTFIFPWTNSSSDDANTATASLGQLKAAFAFRFETDSDANSLSDFWEYRFLGQLGNSSGVDLDGDGFTNLQESQFGTNPNSIDSDQDGMPDYWEILYHLDPLDPSDASLDKDSDGILNLEEYLAGTNPEVPNSLPTGPAVESFGYDQADRLGSVASPVPGSFGLDQEGNLLNVQ